MKLAATLAVLSAAGVTVKSMSMLGEIMFRPRLEAVAEAKRSLDKINHDRDSITYTIKAADELVAQRKNEREAAEQQLSRTTTEMGRHPGQTCSAVFGTDKNGKDYRAQKCTPDPATLALNQRLHSYSEDRAEASKKLEEANSKRDALSVTDANKRSADAEASYRDALFHSQLHSFTSMVFGKDPNQVTEGEIASFLRIFVFTSRQPRLWDRPHSERSFEAHACSSELGCDRLKERFRACAFAARGLIAIQHGRVVDFGHALDFSGTEALTHRARR
jgi:hypothetical protein